MRKSLCPRCFHDGRFLAATSEQARVDYYRCDRCGHVWCYDPKRPEGAVRDITTGKPKAS
ncbi:MAG TPA: hypothetical protein VGF24_20380 [Vicinamibacterales bacterium]